MTEKSTECSIPCNLCGSRDVQEICNVDRDGNYLRTVLCKECGLAWTDPRPNADEIRNFYSKNYRVSYKGTDTPKMKHVYRAGMNAAARYSVLKAFSKPGDAVLDIGAGGGEFVFLLRKLGYEANGIEPNEGYGTYAKEHLGVPVEIGFAQQAELAADSYNVITLHHVFEHLDDPAQMLMRIRGALREGGHLIIDVPNLEATCFAPISRFHTAHLFTFNPATLTAMCKRAGFELRALEVSGDGGVIGAVFQKAAVPTGFEPRLEGNFEKLAAIIAGHTNLSHFLTKHPYIRPVARLSRSLREKKAIRGASSGREVLDRIAETV